MKHNKRFSKQERETVWKKFFCRCAYCGHRLELKDMQIDHKYSIYRLKRMGFSEKYINCTNNLMPSCRMCNYYKGANDIDEFRERIEEELVPGIERTFQYRLASRYGLVSTVRKPVYFYFELLELEEEMNSRRRRDFGMNGEIELQEDYGH